MSAPPNYEFVLDLSGFESEEDRFARLLAHPREVTSDDVKWLQEDPDRQARLKFQRDAAWESKASEREAARRAREAQTEQARAERQRRAAEEAALTAHRRSLIDRQPFIEALRVVDLDPLHHPGRNALDALVQAVEAGQWFNVRIICPNPHCRAPGSTLRQSIHDGSLTVVCGGKRRGEELIECAHPEEIAALVEVAVADHLDSVSEGAAEADEDDDLPEMVNLADLLAEGDGEAASSMFLIDRLWPKSGRVLFGGPAKAGKTTGVDNLLRSLADGAPFLGTFEVEEGVKRVVVIDLELSRRMARDWFARLGFLNPRCVDVIPGRGLARTLDLRNPVLRAKWVERLAGADVVVLDCLNPVLDALDIPTTRVTQFLNLLDEVLIEAGVPNAVVVHHHNDSEQIGGGNKVRGWSDALWNMTMLDANDPSSARYFSAVVRGGGVDEGRLDFEEATGALTYTEGTRADAKATVRERHQRERLSRASEVRRDVKAADHLVMLRTLAADTASRWTAGEIGSVMADTELSLQRVTHARKKCVKDLLLLEESAPGNSKAYTLTDKGRAEIAGAE